VGEFLRRQGWRISIIVGIKEETIGCALEAAVHAVIKSFGMWGVRRQGRRISGVVRIKEETIGYALEAVVHAADFINSIGQKKGSRK